MSQHPTQSTIASIFATTNIATNPTPANFNDVKTVPSSCITYEELVNECQTDDQYKLLASIVETGFPKTQHQTPFSVRECWEFRERLTVADNIVLLNKGNCYPQEIQKANTLKPAFCSSRNIHHAS